MEREREGREGDGDGDWEEGECGRLGQGGRGAMILKEREGMLRKEDWLGWAGDILLYWLSSDGVWDGGMGHLIGVVGFGASEV